MITEEAWTKSFIDSEVVWSLFTELPDEHQTTAAISLLTDKLI